MKIYITIDMTSAYGFFDLQWKLWHLLFIHTVVLVERHFEVNEQSSEDIYENVFLVSCTLHTANLMLYWKFSLTSLTEL